MLWAVIKLFIGMLKGAVIGGGVGYGAYALNLSGGFHWITYGVIGALIGLLVGRPLWSLIADKNATSVAGVLKAVFGFGVGVGLYALVAKAWGGFEITVGSDTRWLHEWQPILGGAIGAVWGGLVELDDASGEKPEKPHREKPHRGEPAPGLIFAEKPENPHRGEPAPGGEPGEENPHRG
jgi:hypothetical protein